MSSLSQYPPSGKSFALKAEQDIRGRRTEETDEGKENSLETGRMAEREGIDRGAENAGLRRLAGLCGALDLGLGLGLRLGQRVQYVVLVAHAADVGTSQIGQREPLVLGIRIADPFNVVEPAVVTRRKLLPLAADDGVHQVAVGGTRDRTRLIELVRARETGVRLEGFEARDMEDLVYGVTAGKV